MSDATVAAGNDAIANVGKLGDDELEEHCCQWVEMNNKNNQRWKMWKLLVFNWRMEDCALGE
jgi:hypothetical protein